MELFKPLLDCDILSDFIVKLSIFHCKMLSKNFKLCSTLIIFYNCIMIMLMIMSVLSMQSLPCCYCKCSVLSAILLYCFSTEIFAGYCSLETSTIEQRETLTQFTEWSQFALKWFCWEIWPKTSVHFTANAVMSSLCLSGGVDTNRLQWGRWQPWTGWLRTTACLQLPPALLRSVR